MGTPTAHHTVGAQLFQLIGHLHIRSRWMAGKLAGWLAGRIDGRWVSERTRWIDGCMHACMDRSIYVCARGQTVGQMDGWE
eukprot:scaffold417170_cov47-Prasinocladus_malaysianus.AAC.1